MERYEMGEFLGEATHAGGVFRVVDRETGESKALKRRSAHTDPWDTREGIAPDMLRQASMLQELHHPNIVSLLDVFLNDQHRLCMIFEYLKTDLKDVLRRQGPLSGAALKRMMFQLLQGVCFCHSQRVMHRDLKPAHLLLSEDGCLKITGFGVARAAHESMHPYTHEVVTLWYRAPEILLGEEHYTFAIDIWSVGCIMAEMARGRLLFRGDTEIGQLFEIFQVLGTPDDMNALWPGVSRLPDFQDAFPPWEPQDLGTLLPTVDAVGVDLFARMLRYDPARRISAADALTHPWFADL